MKVVLLVGLPILSAGAIIFLLLAIREAKRTHHAANKSAPRK